jgi:hypothetical protein
LNAATCATCDRPVPGTEYACASCAHRARRHLDQIADLAGPARDVAHGQTRRGPAVAGGHSSEARLPINPTARQRFDAAQNAVTTVARHVAETRGMPITDRPAAAGPLCPAAARRLDCWHRSCDTIRETSDALAIAAWWLLGHIDWLRHRPEGPEVFATLEAAAKALARLTDRPPDLVVVGACTCGAGLYAQAGAGTVRCRDCGERWDVERSRETLRARLDGMLMTAAEIATMAVVGDPDANRTRVRKLINQWATRRRIIEHGHNAAGDPLYRFGEVMTRLTVESQRSVA